VLRIEVEHTTSLKSYFVDIVNGKDLLSLTKGYCEDITHLYIALEDAFCGRDDSNYALTETTQGLEMKITYKSRFGAKSFELQLALIPDIDTKQEKRLDRLTKKVSSLVPNDYNGYFRFSPRFCHSTLTLFHNNTAVTKHGPSGVHTGVLSELAYSSGEHYWEFKIIRTTEARGVIMIGVQDKYDVLDTFPGTGALSTSGGSLYGYNGLKYFGNSNADAGTLTFRTGDYVGLLLNMNAKTVTWSVNGRKSSAHLLTGKEYRVVVNLYDQCESVEILPQYCYSR